MATVAPTTEDPRAARIRAIPAEIAKQEKRIADALKLRVEVEKELVTARATCMRLNAEKERLEQAILDKQMLRFQIAQDPSSDPAFKNLPQKLERYLKERAAAEAAMKAAKAVSK